MLHRCKSTSALSIFSWRVPRAACQPVLRLIRALADKRPVAPNLSIEDGWDTSCFNAGRPHPLPLSQRERGVVSRRRAMTLLELMIAMTVMLMVVGAMGGLARTVQQSFEYSEGYGAATNMPVLLDRIARTSARPRPTSSFGLHRRGRDGQFLSLSGHAGDLRRAGGGRPDRIAPYSELAITARTQAIQASLSKYARIGHADARRRPGGMANRATTEDGGDENRRAKHSHC